MNRIDPDADVPILTIDKAISIIAETSRTVGQAYFPVAVKGLSTALGVRWAFVCRFDPDTPDKASTIAFWDNGPADNFEYGLKDTPCADVASQGICLFADNVTSLYPLDAMLAEIGAKSYAGTALRALDGRVLGLMAVMDDKPFAAHQTVVNVLDLFSGRAAAELERLATTSINERLGKIVEASVSEAYVFNGKSYRFELVNKGARENLGYTMEELRNLTPWDLKPEYSMEEFLSAVKPLKEGEIELLKFETVHMRKDGSTYPVSVQLQYFPDDGAVFFASITDETDRKVRSEREKLILNEMNHRAKNVLAVVQVLARQTAKQYPDDYVARLEARIAGLAASHDVLVQNSWADVPMEELVRSQLKHFEHLIDKRVKISGGPLRINASAAQGFGLVLHELATNAAKYGALSNDDGCVAISWIEIDSGTTRCLRLSWIESGGPEVVAPSRRGFGSFVIEKSMKSQFGSDIDLDYDSAGLKCAYTVPVDRIVSAGIS